MRAGSLTLIFLAHGTLFRYLLQMISRGTTCHFTVTGSENSICVPAPLLGAYNASSTPC